MCEDNVCHLSDGEKLYWLGFDCAHAGDYRPADHKYGGGIDSEVYRDLDYVVRQVNVMAEELANG